MIKYLSLVVLFPLLAGLWDKEPFTEVNTRSPRQPYHLEAEQLKEQSVFFSQTPDPRIRCRIAQNFSNAGNADAVPVLEKLLEAEKNVTVSVELTASIVKLVNFAPPSKAETFKRFFASPDPRLRANAVAAYLAASGDAKDVFELLKTEDALSVKNIGWQELADKAEKLDAKSLVAFLSATDPVDRAGAAKALALGKADPDGIAELAKSLKDPDPAVRAALAAGLAQRAEGGSKLALSLCSDEHASVRCLIAAITSQKIPELPLKLSNDKDWEVRRLACLGFGGDKDDTATTTLLQRLADNTKAVRNAAENTIIRNGLAEKHHQALGELLDAPAGRCSAIRVAGHLKLKQFADKIHKILEETNDRSTTIRAIKALGRLDRKDSWKLVESKADSPDKSLRRAVAFALGHLAVKDSFPTVVKMTKDKERIVAADAIEALGVIGDPCFADTLFAIIKDTTEKNPSVLRAAACWSIAKTKCADLKIAKQLSDLCLKKVLQTMMGPEYDADFVRVSACWALVDSDLMKDDKTEKVVDYTLTSLLSESKRDTLSVSPALCDYARQARLRLENKKTAPMPVPFSCPPLVGEKIVEKKKE